MRQSLLHKDLIHQNIFIHTAAGVVPCDDRNKLPYIKIAQIIFSGPLGSMNSFLCIGNRVPFKPLLGDEAVLHIYYRS